MTLPSRAQSRNVLPRSAGYYLVVATMMAATRLSPERLKQLRREERFDRHVAGGVSADLADCIAVLMAAQEVARFLYAARGPRRPRQGRRTMSALVCDILGVWAGVSAPVLAALAVREFREQPSRRRAIVERLADRLNSEGDR